MAELVVDTRLTYGVETWLQIKQIIMPLWQRHWEEIGTDKDRISLDPDWQKYDELFHAGALHILGARNSEGVLVGYVFSIVGPHIHYKSTRVAFFDLYWLEPEYRKGTNGVRLFKETEKSLREHGVIKVFGQTKTFKDMSMIFQRLGWKHVESVFTKVL